MLEGLTNTLQCEEREAIRIALYEASRSSSKAYEVAISYSKSDTKERGHTARSSKGRWNLPKLEKDEIAKAAKSLSISDKVFLRLAIIWLAKGIKHESIIRLTKSPRIPKDEVAMQWSRDNRDKPPSEAVKKLKDARDDAKAISDYIFEKKQYKSLNEYESNRSKHSEARNQEAQELLEETSDNENWEKSFLEENPDVDDIEFLIRCKMREYKCDYEDAKMFVETEMEEMDELVKMTSQEQLAFLKQKDFDETSYERGEKERQRELKQRHQDEMDAWEAKRNAREKTWVGFVNARRMEKEMMGRPEPYPHLPNPLPEDYPIPDDWNPEEIS